MNLEQRLKELERATAVAYLNANLSRERYARECRKVDDAIAQDKHFRLVIETIDDSGSVHATIEVEE